MRPGSLDYYTGLAREDYYTEGGEPPGHWYGKGADLLGLSGIVEKRPLSHVYSGVAPDGTTKLTQTQSHDHHGGWDLTFSAPKSVSVFWSQAGPELRHQIESSLVAAVHDTLAHMERHSCYTRRGKGGTQTEQTAGMLAALFPHQTSRSQDPQLHIHALIMNAAPRQDGSWGTLYGIANKRGEKRHSSHALTFYDEKLMYGALFQASLAKHLQSTLGVAVERTRHGFELANVPKPLMEHFSSRSEDIQEELRASGKSGAKAAEQAAKTTRERKSYVPRSELFARWRSVAQEYGFTADHVLTNEVLSPDPQAAVSDALNALTERGVPFTRQELTRQIALRSPGRMLALHQIHAATDELLRSDSRVSVLSGQDLTNALYTTNESSKHHQKAARYLLRISGGTGRGVRSASKLALYRGKSTLINNGNELSAEQVKALTQLTRANGRVRYLRGLTAQERAHVLEAASVAWQSRQVGEKTGLEVVIVTDSRKPKSKFRPYANARTYRAENFARAVSPRSHWDTLLRIDDVHWEIDEGRRRPFRMTQGMLAYAEKVKASPRYQLTKRTVIIVDDPEQMNPRDLSMIYRAAHKAGSTIIVSEPAPIYPWAQAAEHKPEHAHRRTRRPEPAQDHGHAYA